MKKINYLLIAVLFAACTKQIEAPKEVQEDAVINYDASGDQLKDFIGGANWGYTGYAGGCLSETHHLVKEDVLLIIDGGDGDNGRTGAFCLKDRTIEGWLKEIQTKVHYSVIPEDSALEGWSFDNYKICNSDVPVGFGPNILDERHDGGFAKRFSRRLDTHYPIEYFPTNAEEIKAIRIRKCGQ